MNNSIEKFRCKKGLTVHELATLIGVKDNIVREWEDGFGKYTLDNLRKLSKIFGVSIDEIVDEERKPFDVSALNVEDQQLIINVVERFSTQRYANCESSTSNLTDFPEKFEIVNKYFLNEGTQTSLAELLSVNRATINRWQSGVNTPTFYHMQKISYYSKISLDYLISDKTSIDVSARGLRDEEYEAVSKLIECLNYKTKENYKK